MKVKDYFRYFRLKAKLRRRMTDIKETMALRTVVDVYAKYVCKMNHWPLMEYDNPSKEFCDTGFAFMNGYLKALHDNGLEFQNGMVKKRDIAHEMPGGAFDYYLKDAIAETMTKSIEVLRAMLEQYEYSQQNINVIVSAFEKRIKESNYEKNPV